VLFPIRKLSRKTAAAGAQYVATDDLETLTGRVYKLLDEVGHTRDELELSRARLLHSEKMAVVGKLAADVAHSIRNPMTSIKMRLFSLERSLGLNSAQKEDFEVVSEEMRRLDNILRNFLEFSRPPKLRMQTLSLSEIMDQTLQLLQHRLEMCGVKVEYYRGHFLPDIEADPELLKEVMVNLIVNACEAMREGGRLIISEEDAVAEHIGRAILVKITDTGPGIPDSIQDKVLEPFFSTKEEGTGLGLSIALRIVEEHGGRLELRSEEGKGTTFIVTLPLREDKK
jgi:signal transduction histidine kinase